MLPIQTHLARSSDAAAISERWRGLLDALPVGAYVCDGFGLIVHHNPVAEQLWGRPAKLRHSDDRYCASHRLYSPLGKPIPRNECWMAQALLNGCAYHGRSLLVERADGGRTYGLAYAHPLRDRHGETVGALTLVADSHARPHNAILAMIELTVSVLLETPWTAAQLH